MRDYDVPVLRLAVLLRWFPSIRLGILFVQERTVQMQRNEGSLGSILGRATLEVCKDVQGYS